jgi:DNA-binding response OmpR family regulator
MRILIVEDQENLAKLIKKGLEAEGFAADYVLDGESAQTRINVHHQDYDLIILDLMLPKKSGLDICRDTRCRNIPTPILMLTANDTPADISTGLDMGADDYLPKPFSFDVLLARIRAILRRPKDTLPLQLKFRGINLDPATKKVNREGKDIHLTLKEFSLLEYLARNTNKVVTREQILSGVWDFSFDSFANVVDVHITNLRKKLGDKDGTIIETVRGVGYRISC